MANPDLIVKVLSQDDYPNNRIVLWVSKKENNLKFFHQKTVEHEGVLYRIIGSTFAAPKWGGPLPDKIGLIVEKA